MLRDGRNLNWRPAYTTVAGVLPPSEWRLEAKPRSTPVPVGLARTQIQVTTGGKVKLSLDSTSIEGLSFYLDGRRVEPVREQGGPAALILDLAAGEHALGVAISSSRRDGIRCILEDVPGSPARAKVVLGK